MRTGPLRSSRQSTGEAPRVLAALLELLSVAVLMLLPFFLLLLLTGSDLADDVEDSDIRQRAVQALAEFTDRHPLALVAISGLFLAAFVGLNLAASRCSRSGSSSAA